MYDALKNRINLMIVQANSRTIPRRPEELLDVDPELWDVLGTLEAMHARGEFHDASKLLLQTLPENVIFDDPWVANALGLSLSQGGDEQEAWPFFLRSEQLGLAMARSAATPQGRQVGLKRAACAANNLAVSLKKVCRYSEALQVAERAVEHAPWFWPGYTALVAVLEGRNAPGDREQVLDMLRRMFDACPGAVDNPDVLGALRHDADYAALRVDARFADLVPV